MPSLSRSARALLLVTALSLPASLSAQLFEGFDDVGTLGAKGWGQRNNSDPLGETDWFQGESVAVFPSFSGAPNSYIAANFRNSGGGTISNWLITPTLSLINGATFSFFTRTTDGQFPDRLELRLSTSGASDEVGSTATSVGDFDRLLLSINPDLTSTGYPIDWARQTVTLAGLSSPTTGRFAFRYFVTGTGTADPNADYIGIDEVSYAVPEPASLALLSVGLIGVMARRRRALS